ncbi:MAG: sensor histidine kinase, partial [Pseudomonadota bacterium]
LDDHTARQRHLADREALLFTSRSLSIGEMATTIAHELNQPLGSVANLLNLLASRLKTGHLDVEETAPVIDRLLTQIGYASGIISRMREYVDDRPVQKRQLDLRQVVGRAVDLLDWECRRDGISVSVEIAEDLPAFCGDAVMVQQVLVNLARNGIEAMKYQPCEERTLTFSARLESDMVDIIISDTGAGLSDEVAERLFTPFFSTKGGGGMGIGLNICRSIAERHGGGLWHEQTTGGGTSFHINFPVTPIEKP